LPVGQISSSDSGLAQLVRLASKRTKSSARNDEICETIQFDRGRQVQSLKNSSFRKSKIVHILAHPASTQGRMRIVTKREAGCDGRERIVRRAIREQTAKAWGLAP
jgi:hypothetical protein